MVAPSGGGGGGGGMPGGGSTYTNCLIVNGEVLASDPDIGRLVHRLTQDSTIRQGGVPVGKATP